MEIINTINQKFGEKVQIIEDMDYPTIKVDKENFFELMKELKNSSDFKFHFLLDLTAVEYDDFFEAVYHLMNLENSQIIRVKVNLNKQNPSIASLVSIYKTADVQERETYDLLGVNYEGHPGLTRILCPDDFVGHPLRKDFSMQDRGSK